MDAVHVLRLILIVCRLVEVQQLPWNLEDLSRVLQHGTLRDSAGKIARQAFHTKHCHHTKHSTANIPNQTATNCLNKPNLVKNIVIVSFIRNFFTLPTI